MVSHGKMTCEELLERFGLPASAADRDEIRRLLAEEVERGRRGESGEEMLRTLCVQLFSLGIVDDAPLIWKAKQSSFDAACGLDIQFICGAGLGPTKDYLARSSDPSATAALEHLQGCEATGDFEEWTPQETLDHYRGYFGLNKGEGTAAPPEPPQPGPSRRWGRRDRAFHQEKKRTLPSRAVRIVVCLFTLLLFAYILFLVAYRPPFFDPDPKGNGSSEEAASITRQFRECYRTKDRIHLPRGYVGLKDLGEDGMDGGWMVYYATGSHGWTRGGTIVLMDDTGRIDVYYGHHCASGDGGTVTLSAEGGSIWPSGSYYEKKDEVRRAFDESFDHQRTEHIAPSGEDSPPD